MYILSIKILFNTIIEKKNIGGNANMSNRKHKRLLLIIFTVILNLTIVTSSVYAHSGRTDSSDGHRDNKNASGLESYHHHGYGAHLHSNGVCPCESNSNSLTTSPEKETISKAEVRESGYEKGYDDGYRKKQNSSSSYSGEYAEEYKSEYDLGYEKGRKQIESQIAEAHDKGYKDGNTQRFIFSFAIIHQRMYYNYIKIYDL